jgi:hypothetical protein
LVVESIVYWSKIEKLEATRAPKMKKKQPNADTVKTKYPQNIKKKTSKKVVAKWATKEN